MQTIRNHRLKFGELAGPLVHGASFFDWQLISTQTIAEAVGYSFEEILADDGIPYAPVGVDTSVVRYPATGNAVTVETVPTSVGDSSVELLYEVTDGDGEKFATARMTHVTIAPSGSALELPERARSAFADACVDRSPEVGPQRESDEESGYPTYSETFRVRSPHIEGADLAYFEEYPRFADVALERYLEEQGTSRRELRGEKQPYRIRDWHWEFKSPVRFETDLIVDCDVISVDRETITVAHTFSSDGGTHITGTTEYGCFDRTGAPVPFDDEMLAPFEP